MRAKIASRAHGHAFEKRFLELDPLQLRILYQQALKEEIEERKEKVTTIKTVNDAWVGNIKHAIEQLQLFINPKLFKHIQDLKDLEVYRQELSEDNFKEVWSELMNVVPQEVIVEEETSSTDLKLPKADEEMEKFLTGWVRGSKRQRKAGDT